MRKQAATQPRECIVLYAISTLAIVVLTSCSQTCTQAAITGNYRMRSGSNTYDLSLSNNGTGTLYINGKMMEHLSWERWSGNDQIFLHVSRGMLDRLDALTGHAIPAGVANFRSGYLASVRSAAPAPQNSSSSASTIPSPSLGLTGEFASRLPTGSGLVHENSCISRL